MWKTIKNFFGVKRCLKYLSSNFDQTQVDVVVSSVLRQLEKWYSAYLQGNWKMQYELETNVMFLSIFDSFR